MKQRTRDGKEYVQESGQDQFLARLYASRLGRMALRPLTRPWVSGLGGRVMNSSLSRPFIASFIRKNGIDMSQYESGPFKSYNAFFIRRIREGARVVDMKSTHLISPADSKLSVCPVTAEGRFVIKHTSYTLAQLLKNETLAREYEGGQVLIFRLTVDDYHRYCYMADGEKGENIFVPGVLHTVNPVANDYYPIYKENAREYTVLHTDVFGNMIIMEVGALMVGRIRNHHGACRVRRGQEKGYFEFGGSTIVAVLKKDAAVLDEDILRNQADGFETVVRMGEKIGTAL